MSTDETPNRSHASNKVKRADSAVISIASPDTIRSWSSGEVQIPETMEYDSGWPKEVGLYSQKIFGPINNLECRCGRKHGKKDLGVVCERCGVKVTSSRVRSKRMGHIELAVPVSHIWFLKNRPSPIALLLNVSASDLEHVVYYEAYLVLDGKNTPLKCNKILNESEYFQARGTYGEDSFVAKMGAAAVRDALSRVDLQQEIAALQQAMIETRNMQIRKTLARRIRLLQGFHTNNVRPEWMVLTVLPVIPPNLRPLVPLGDERHVKRDPDDSYRPVIRQEMNPVRNFRYLRNDVNDLYRRVIAQNLKLRGLIERRRPESFLSSEKRRLQELVDALFDNGRHKPVITNKSKQPLQSLSDRLKGKSGRFRQNLLGKRVDYSGRSVIVIGPELKLHQCGLPKEMALALFEPFIIRRLRELGFVHTVIRARKLRKRAREGVWEVFKKATKGHNWGSDASALERVVCHVLHQVVKGRLVLLNRAPTLHRLSIQAFEPVLIEGQAIRLHPLVCTAYNADFDGDQMAVHVPLSPKAQIEARQFMMAPNNIFKPSDGKPIMGATQDIALGCFYLTAEPRTPPPANPSQLKLFWNKTEVIFARSDNAVTTHERIRLLNPDHGRIGLANPDEGHRTEFADPNKKVIETTVGRVLFSEIWPEELGFYNAPAGKSEISYLIQHCYNKCGQERTVAALDRLKELGFREATRAGISIGIDDMLIPKEKEQEIEAAQKQIKELEKQYRKGVITPGERRNMEIDIWTQCTDQISEAMFKTLETNPGMPEHNPLWLMLNSGARGTKQQVRQIAGLRGLMVKPIGKPEKHNLEPKQEMRERPILSSFREGLGPIDWFVSTQRALQGLGDTALKTASCGYLTRKLVQVAHEIFVDQEDCVTPNGRWVQAVCQNQEEIAKLVERLVGRFACDTILDPIDPKKVLISANQEIREGSVKTLVSAGVEKVRIRSVLTCGSSHGVCVKCYGRNLATGSLVKLGEAVGIIAAQSIGEPGTQLTMRTFHTGGVASEKGNITMGLPRVDELLEARHPKDASIISHIDGIAEFHRSALGKRCMVVRNQQAGIRKGHNIPIYKYFLVSEGDYVRKGDQLTEGPIDPHDTLGILGPQEFQERLVNEIQAIYGLQGVTIHEKHIEIIVRQMLRHVRIIEPGDTRFLSGEEVGKTQFEEENARVEKAGGQPAEAQVLFLGISKASLKSDSFLSAAGFQHTTQVLTEAAVMSKSDDILGLKERIITGGLIPAGTGFEVDRKRRAKPPAKSASEIDPVAPSPLAV